MLFDSEKKVYKKIDEEKEHLWTAVNEITARLDQQSKGLIELQKRAPEHYREIVNNSRNISKYRNRVSERSDEVEQLYAAIIAAKEAIEKTQAEVNQAKAEIETRKDTSEDVFNEQNKRLQELVQQQTIVEGMQSELIEFTDQKDELQESVNQIQEILAESESSSKRMSNLLSGALSQRIDIKEAHEQIFGYVLQDEEEEEVVVVGLKEELDSSYTKLKEELNNFSKELASVTKTQTSTLEGLEKHYEESLTSFKTNSESKYDAVVKKSTHYYPQH